MSPTIVATAPSRIASTEGPSGPNKNPPPPPAKTTETPAAVFALGQPATPAATYPRPVPSPSAPDATAPLATDGDAVIAGDRAVAVDILHSDSGYQNKVNAKPAPPDQKPAVTPAKLAVTPAKPKSVPPPAAAKPAAPAVAKPPAPAIAKPAAPEAKKSAAPAPPNQAPAKPLLAPTLDTKGKAAPAPLPVKSLFSEVALPKAAPTTAKGTSAAH